MDVVIVTWQGGGVTQPAIGLGRLLVGRGHRVRVVAPAALGARVRVAGCVHRSHPPSVEFDAARGRAVEDQWDYFERLLFGGELAAAVDAELAAAPADVLVVDYVLHSVLGVGERRGVPVVLLMHMAERFHGVVPSGEGEQPWGWRWQYHQVNACRADLGLAALRVGPRSLGATEIRRAARAVVVMPREFDPWPHRPANVVHVGPIFEEERGARWESPWPIDDPRPLVVVSMGTMYMAHEDVIGRVVAALSCLEVRVLVLSGLQLEPHEIVAAGDDVEVRRYMPHGAVLPDAALVVTHGGMGTLMAAFAAGVPCLVLPLGRDQESNAARAAELGAAVVLPSDASVAAIGSALRDALASEPLHDGARRMAEAVARYDAGTHAVAEIEAVAAQRD